MDNDDLKPSIDFTLQRMEAVNRLAAGIAHEFNNVLQIVHGYVSVARISLPVNCAARADLEAALEATDRAAKLSSRLLQFARAHDQEQDQVGTDINDAVRSLQLLLRPIISEDIRLVAVTDESLPLVAVGDGSIRQALLNLCVNARDAMPHGGELALETSFAENPNDVAAAIGDLSEQAYVRVSVSDTGEGMPSWVQANAFQPFFSTKAPGEGTGLGLAMVAACVVTAGGAIAIASTPGAGTRFDLYLPIAPDAETQPESGQRSASPTPSEIALA